MSRKTAKQIVEESLPDLEVVDQPFKVEKSAQHKRRPGASLSELRKKYLGEDYGEELVALGADAGDDEDGDIEIVHVRAKRTPADPADDPGAKTLIVSRTKGIIGSQG